MDSHSNSMRHSLLSVYFQMFDNSKTQGLFLKNYVTYALKRGLQIDLFITKSRSSLLHQFYYLCKQVRFGECCFGVTKWIFLAP